MTNETARQLGTADGHASALAIFTACLKCDFDPATAACLRAEEIAATVVAGAAMRERGNSTRDIKAYTEARQDAFDSRFAAYAKPFGRFLDRIAKAGK